MSFAGSPAPTQSPSDYPILACFYAPLGQGPAPDPEDVVGLLDLNRGVGDGICARQHDDTAHEDEDQEEHKADEVEN